MLSELPGKEEVTPRTEPAAVLLQAWPKEASRAQLRQEPGTLTPQAVLAPFLSGTFFFALPPPHPLALCLFQTDVFSLKWFYLPHKP